MPLVVKSPRRDAVTAAGALVAGIVFGLSGGISPGPLLTLVISETLNHGVGAGVRVAMAPLITDVPIVGVVLLLLSRLTDAEPILGVISILGAVFLGGLGVRGLSFEGAVLEEGKPVSRSLAKGVATNFLNPSPYLFWSTIGGPTVIRTSAQGAVIAVAFVVVFYIMLVGSKVAVAVAVGRSRRLLHSSVFVWLNRGLGIVLLVFAALFLKDGLRYLNVLSG
jgi:threonine/homoserine/homoserine lactone efflux protein